MHACGRPPCWRPTAYIPEQNLADGLPEPVEKSHDFSFLRSITPGNSAHRYVRLSNSAQSKAVPKSIRLPWCAAACVSSKSVTTRAAQTYSLETNIGTGIIEAKVDATDPLVQSHRYPARWIALLTHRVPRKAIISRASYVTWQQLADVLESLGASGSPRLRVLSKDLLGYMQEHHMVRDRKSVEIYAREINEPVTLALFLKAQLYGCNYQAGSRLAEALYFAPHFGKSITNEHPGVSIGISYVARIESVGHATTWQEFCQLMSDERGAAWWNRHKAILQDLRQKWHWNKGQHRSFLLLGRPRLAFNPPVRKEKLQRRQRLAKQTVLFLRRPLRGVGRVALSRNNTIAPLLVNCFGSRSEKLAVSITLPAPVKATPARAACGRP